jgi:hypothetical protein
MGSYGFHLWPVIDKVPLDKIVYRRSSVPNCFAQVFGDCGPSLRIPV